MKFLYTLILLLLINQSFAVKYYVKTTGSSANTGLSWSNAFSSIQSALSVAIYGDEIWVAAGQYKPTTSNDRTVSFVLKNGVNIYGGFAGIETSLTQRDIANNPTTLSGDIGQIGENTDNSNSIIRGSNINSTVVLDGFRIINGYSSIGYYGGAIHYTRSLNGNLWIKNCYFYSNSSYYYGGAVYIDGAKVTIDNCEFRNNQAISGGNGGAIYALGANNGSNTLILNNDKFIGNTSRIGACLANTGAYKLLQINKCIFTNNTSTYSILDIEYFDSLKIYNSYVIGNTVNDFNSNIIEITHYTNRYTEDCEIANCTIADNYNIYQNTIIGEMMSLSKDYYKIRNCIIYGNTSFNGRQINGGLQISNSIVEGGYVNGTNIYDFDPRFKNPNYTNSNFDATSFDYTLKSTSPGINNGDNSFVNNNFLTDLNNNNRIQNGTVDIGAYESNNDNCAPPAPTNTSNNTALNICRGTRTTLTASGTGNISWYAAATGGVKLGSGNSFTTPNLTTPTTYYAQDSNACNVSLQRTAINVSILSVKTTNISQKVCPGQSYRFKGNDLTIPGIYRDTLKQANGCDSFIVLTLAFNPSKTTNISQKVCPSQSYRFNGNDLTIPGIYRDTLLQVNGCDSFIVLTFEFNPSKTTTLNQTLSSGQSYTFNGTILTTQGTYRDTLQQANGCDSFIILNLTVLTSLANNISFVDKIKVYPNPVNDFVKIELNAKKTTDFNMVLISIDGKILFNKKYTHTQTINDEINLKEFSSGIYLLQINSENEQSTYQVFKK